MNVIPFDRKARVGLVLAATLAAGAGTSTAFAAPQVERDDTAAPAPAAPPAPAAAPAPALPPRPPASTQSERERDARLQEAQKRLEKAAAEVAALSSEIAAHAMEGIGAAFAGASRRSIIGVQVDTVESGAGATVRVVSPGGAAEAAGMRVGDVIVSVNGNEVKGGAREAVRMLREIEPDTTAKVRVMRDGKPKELHVTARRFDPRTFAYRSAPDVDFDFDFDFDPSRGTPDGTPWASVFGGGISGMQITALTPQLARYFNTDQGLLVVRAPKDDVYKLQDGDVILNIDGRVPNNGSHVTRILRSYQPGEKLTMHIMRDRKALDLVVTLPEQGRNRRTRAARADGETSDL
jgi:C-terminal processing protease CtpA/Prc